MKKLFTIALGLCLVLGANANSGVTEPTNTTTITGGPMVTFAGKRSGDISLSEAKAAKKLTIKYGPSGTTIEGYKLVITKSGKTFEFVGTSHMIDTKVQGTINSLKSGDTINFTELEVNFGGKRTMHAPPIKLTVK